MLQHSSTKSQRAQVGNKEKFSPGEESFFSLINELEQVQKRCVENCQGIVRPLKSVIKEPWNCNETIYGEQEAKKSCSLNESDVLHQKKNRSKQIMRALLLDFLNFSSFQ